MCRGIVQKDFVCGDESFGLRSSMSAVFPASLAAHDKIAVVDFGGQYAHLIATKIRQANVKAEILLPDDPPEKIAGFKGVVLSGGPALLS